jgi:hypothetical protein
VSLEALTSRLRSFNRIELAAITFYVVSGIVFLVFLPFIGFPPQVALVGILSLITVYGIITKRKWAPWVLFILFAAASTFSIYTLAVSGFSNLLVGFSLAVYAVLTWVFAVYILLINRRL